MPTVAGVLTADGSKRCGRIWAERLCGTGYLVGGNHAVEGKICQLVFRQGDDRRSIYLDSALEYDHFD